MKILTKTDLIQDVTSQLQSAYQHNAVPQNQYLIIDDNGKILNDNCNEMFSEGKYIPTYTDLIQLKWSTDVDSRGEGNIYPILRTSQEIEQVQKGLIYQQKSQEHKGYRYKITVNYDYVTSVSAYDPLIKYVGNKQPDIITEVIRTENNGIVTNTLYIYSTAMSAQHQAIINADPHFVIEDLETFVP